MAHDLVIEHARIIDGLGTPARDGSLAVKDGRIAAEHPAKAALAE